MSFTNYTIVPSDSVVVIDGQAASGVDMTGIDPTIHAIQWYGLLNEGVIEYSVDPNTGILPAQGSFTDPTTYQTQVTEAEAIIFAQNNPVTYYVTVPSLLYGNTTYLFGQAITVSTPNPVQPTGTTTLVPPTPETYQQLYWYNDAWVVSPVDPTLSLSAAQADLSNVVFASAASNVNIQARIYSVLTLSTDADPGSFPCADNAATDLDTYQASMVAEANLVINQIQAATSVTDLFTINPIIDPAF